MEHRLILGNKVGANTKVAPVAAAFYYSPSSDKLWKQPFWLN